MITDYIILVNMFLAILYVQYYFAPSLGLLLSLSIINTKSKAGPTNTDITTKNKQ
jgi:hypothetical protein